MKTAQTLAAAFGLVAMAHAHMEMTSPAPFRSKNNPNAEGDIDFSMTSPLSASGSDFPCKGAHVLFGTPKGKPTAEWQAGSSQSFTISGGANHNGGSCQASLSYDGGSTWSVIHSYIGNCPPAGESSFDFTVPTDAPSGEAIFAWTWFNKVGNREMYMNCAPVSITGGSSAKRDLSSLPAMFVANVGNGCSTTEGTDVVFPDPGTEVDNSSAAPGPPAGDCPAGNPGAAPPANPAPPASSAAPAPPASSPAAPVSPAPSSAPAAPAPPAAPTTVPGGVFLTAPPVEAPPAAPTEAPIEAPVAPPSTLITATRSSEAPVAPTAAPIEEPAQPAPPAPAPTTPAAPVTPPVTPPSPPTGGAGGFPAGEACTEEGIFNCVGGTQFQRCASGMWSVMMPVAAGTTCAEGQSNNLQSLRKRAYGIRGRRVSMA
ncbi:hypothetical protein B0I35DRAFT_428392 [Stachybotrys elegans]|uniref:Spore coat protein SP96 n=1 Tax=Stachybotrys elegans TaxID=80388 RepID=A0A8K0SSX6_9HYPO|nr:hypothetical protein B0I35DRAFT_428392 [Stachybotrys elegans]